MKRINTKIIAFIMAFLIAFPVSFISISAESNGIGTASVKVSSLRIRSGAGTSYSNLGYAGDGQTYTVYETVSNQGYTWYRIDEGQWIADLNGGWVDYTANPVSADTSSLTKIGTATVKVNLLSIRSAAGTSNDRVGMTEDGNTYDVYAVTADSTYTWYQIGTDQWIADLNGGWVTYTAIESTPATTPEPTPEATVTPEATPDTTVTASSIGTAVVHVSNLNIRNSSSTSSARIGQAEAEKTYTVLAKSSDSKYTWYEIDTDQWIADYNGSWVTFTSNETSSSAEETVTPTPTPTPTVTYIGTAKVIVNNLRIRTAAGTGASVSGYAENGKTYNVISKTSANGYTWYQIDSNAWIADYNGSYVTYLGEGQSSSTTATTTTVTGAASNPYSGGWSNCTWGAWQLVYQKTGVKLARLGNACDWLTNAQALGYSTGSLPAINSVVVYSRHVAVVVAIDFGTQQVQIEEGGFNGGYNTRWCPFTRSTSGQITQGYIYIQ